MASPDEWSAQCRGHLRNSTNMKDNTHHAHTLSHPDKANMEWWLRRPNDIRGPWRPKVSWHLSTGEEKPRKNLTQETCSDRGSNPGPLRDKRAYYHLGHSGGKNLYHHKKYLLKSWRNWYLTPVVKYPPLVKLQHGFLSLQWKTCLRAELRRWFLSLQWRTCPWAEYSDDDDDY